MSGAGNRAEANGEADSAGGRPDALRKRRELPGHLWMHCPGCSGVVYKPLVEEKLWVCPSCNHHFEIPSWKRIELLLDPGSFVERFADLAPLDPLEFQALRSYKERLVEAQLKTGLKDACIVGTGRIEGMPVVFGVSDSRFLRGSMGSVVGEKIARATELASQENLPLVFVSGSGGGARMDEGILSLLQMAKTSAALGQLQRNSGLFISILTNPTMGGAMASFAALGDVILAEPKALIGFAGPNVVRETIRAELPEGFQTSEFLLEHGFIDKIVNREDLRRTVAYFLRMFAPR